MNRFNFKSLLSHIPRRLRRLAKYKGINTPPLGAGIVYFLSRCCRGSVAVEFALTLPLIIMCVLGTVELTSFIRADLKLRHSAEMLAMMVGQQTQLTNAQLTDLCHGSALALEPYPAVGFGASVVSKTRTTYGIQKDWQSVQACSGPSPQISNTIPIQIPEVSESIIVVTAVYNYKPKITFLLPLVIGSSSKLINNNYVLEETVYNRPRSDTTILCPDCS
jgi:Flp pilus assembly protein TadG